MKEYFTLQLKMLNREMTALGIEPIIGYPVGVFAFYTISMQLFEKTQYAEYVYLFLALSFVIKLSEEKRNDFLKLCFSTIKYIKLRFFENLIVATPFIIILTIQSKYLISTLLLFLISFLILLSFKSKLNFTLPTPFYKHPFEFTVGFRTNFIIYLFAYFLAFMSITENNFNLGIFSLIVVLLACLNYYVNSEKEFYVWIFSLTPKDFISYKLKNIIGYSTLLCLPITVCLSVFFSSKIDIIVGFQCLGYLFIFTTMLAKYSVFPEKLNIRFGIIFALTVWLPPLLLLIIPYLYLQSTKKLNQILE
jgi:hypothetical protein